MLKRIDVRGLPTDSPSFYAALPRPEQPGDEPVAAVRDVIRAVRERGDAALREFTARFDGAELEPRDVELVATVPYAADTFVLFVNSLAAVHGVTPRQPTPATRMFFNLIGEVAFPLFDLKSRQQPLRGLRRAWSRLSDRLAGRQRDSGQRYD